MKKTTVSGLSIISLFFVLFNLHSLSAQMLREIPLKKQIEKSTLVIEGKVIAKKSYWNGDHNNIYTANTIEVYKVFKGVPSNATIEVITPGGTVGLDSHVVIPSLKLRVGDLGVFTLTGASVLLSEYKSTISKYKPYSSLQGFYKYNIENDIAFNPFIEQERICTDLYTEIKNHTGENFVELSKFDVKSAQAKISQAKALAVPSGITFSPTSATAGTETLLTIMGSDFGANQGSVAFSDADDGGNSYTDALSTQIKSWSNSVITVLIPDFAGTGKIRVTDSNGGSATSSGDLNITYSQINAVFELPDNSDDFYSYPSRLVADDGSGGYVWHMFTDFNDDTEHPGAKADFLAALDTWRCETGVNWTIGTVSAVDVIASDGINIIRFDNGNELDDGVLGRCSYYISGCGSSISDFDAFVDELDIVFDDDIDDPDTAAVESWHFGAGFPGIREFDFQSVALHELGHAHQLGHVIDNSPQINNSNDIMYYALQNFEQQRVLKSTNVAAGHFTQNINESATRPCFGKAPMSNYNCSLGIPDVGLNKSISIYPNPVRNQLFIENKSQIKLERAVIYDMNGRKISEHDLSDDAVTKIIDLSHFSKGMYLIQVLSGDAVTTKKILVY